MKQKKTSDKKVTEEHSLTNKQKRDEQTHKTSNIMRNDEDAFNEAKIASNLMK